MGLLDILRSRVVSNQNSLSPFKYSFMVLGCKSVCQPRRDDAESCWSNTIAVDTHTVDV